MRIIAGKYRGRVLSDFDGDRIRPTSDRVKESLFGILSPVIYGARVLDLFSGSGNLGLEAISRGAKEVVFNDASKDSVSLLKKNIAKLKITDGYTILNYDFIAALKSVKGKFDIIFADPPYAEGYEKSVLSAVTQNGLLGKDGIVVYEKDREVDCEAEGLIKYDVRKYGKAVLTFFRRDNIR